MSKIDFAKSKLSQLLKNPAINFIRGVPFPDLTGELAQVEIGRKIIEQKSCLIARVGRNEGYATEYFLNHRSILPKNNQKLYETNLRDNLKFGAGYFPTDDVSIDRLAKLYLAAISQINIYAAWTPSDKRLVPMSAAKIRLYDLDPFFTKHRWSLALDQKRVCIVSPFTETMKKQYLLREKLFSRQLLPPMDISYVKAPMTHCNNKVDNTDWFQNLDRLCDQVLSLNPEVVIIGAGAYGLPLGSNMANCGLVAIVLGGSTQLLFGIKGKRWENDKQYRTLINQYWVRPSLDEQPVGFNKLEINGGAYW